MPAISMQDLENAKTDVDHIATVATSLAPTATDRLGHVKQTLAGAVGSIAAITDRGAWAAGAAYMIKDLVTVAGIVYVCVSGHTAGATFAGDSARWRVYQGLLKSDFDEFVADAANQSDPAKGAAAFGLPWGETVTEFLAKFYKLDQFATFAAAVAAVPAGSILDVSGHSFTIGQQIIEKQLTIVAYGAVITLSGSSAGVLVQGTVSGFNWFGGRFEGDGVNRDASPSTAQIGIILGNTDGATVQDCIIDGAYFHNVNVGAKVADGRNGGGKARRNKIINCTVDTAVGTVGGVGYGFQFSQADGSSISNCNAISCGRHGFYFSEGADYKGSNLTAKSCGVGALRGAMSISRSRNVTIAGYNAIGNNDVGLAIDTDAQGLAPDNVLDGVFVTGYTARDNTLGDLRVGTSSNPAVEGFPQNVRVEMIAASLAGTNNPSVVVGSGKHINIDADIDCSTAGASNRVISLNADGGAAYSDDISITGKWRGSYIGAQIASALCTGSSVIKLLPKDASGVASLYEYLATPVNPNLLAKDQYGKTNRLYTSSGAGITIPVGRVDFLRVEASGATTISNFSGGTEWQEVTLYFANGNTTLLAANLYLAGAVNFTGTAADVVTLIYHSGAWREKCRSVN